MSNHESLSEILTRIADFENSENFYSGDSSYQDLLQQEVYWQEIVDKETDEIWNAICEERKNHRD